MIGSIFRAFARRVFRKVASIAPVLLAAVVVFGVVWLLLWLVTPYLPERWQQMLELLGRGDWRDASDRLRESLAQSGVPIEIAFIALQALQVLVAPIPGQLAGFLGGYLFGFGYGLLLTMIGLTIGSVIAMGLGRLFGVQVVRRFVPTDLMAKVDDLIARGGLWNFFVIFMLPALPDDAICFVAGLTRLSLWKLTLVMVLGRLPGMAVLCFVGSSVGDGDNHGYIIFAAAMVISLVVWLYSDEFEALAFGAKKDMNKE